MQSEITPDIFIRFINTVTLDNPEYSGQLRPKSTLGESFQSEVSSRLLPYIDSSNILRGFTKKIKALQFIVVLCTVDQLEPKIEIEYIKSTAALNFAHKFCRSDLPLDDRLVWRDFIVAHSIEMLSHAQRLFKIEPKSDFYLHAQKRGANCNTNQNITEASFEEDLLIVELQFPSHLTNHLNIEQAIWLTSQVAKKALSYGQINLVTEESGENSITLTFEGTDLTRIFELLNFSEMNDKASEAKVFITLLKDGNRQTKELAEIQQAPDVEG